MKPDHDGQELRGLGREGGRVEAHGSEHEGQVESLDEESKSASVEEKREGLFRLGGGTGREGKTDGGDRLKGEVVHQVEQGACERSSHLEPERNLVEHRQWQGEVPGVGLEGCRRMDAEGEEVLRRVEDERYEEDMDEDVAGLCERARARGTVRRLGGRERRRGDGTRSSGRRR